MAADDCSVLRFPHCSDPAAPAPLDLHLFLPATANLLPLTSNFQRRLPTWISTPLLSCLLLPISSSASIVDCTACEVLDVHSLPTIKLHISTPRFLFPFIRTSPLNADSSKLRHVSNTRFTRRNCAAPGREPGDGY